MSEPDPITDKCIFCDQAWITANGMWVVTFATPACDHETLDGRT